MKRKFAVMLLALAMVFTMGTGVFAANAPATAADGAYLVKYLKLADGVTNPEIAFTFNFKAEDGGPAIADQTVTPATTSDSEKDGNSVVGSIKISDILPAFTHAGVYHYTVTETATAAGFTDGVRTATVDDVTTTESLTFSKESYTMEVRVKNGSLDKPEVTIQKDGEGDKTDPTDNDPTVTDDNKDHGDQDTIPGFSFTNVYTKTAEKPVQPDPENPEDGLYGAAGITKTVAGNYADQTFAFPFTLTMNAPAGTEAATVEALLITGDDVTGAKKVTVTYGEAYNFTLTHGQSLVFKTLPAGVTYTVTENLGGCGVENEGKYTPSLNGTAGTMGASLTSGTVTVKDAEGAENDGHFTNTVKDDDVTPTGIIINNLPYVLLIALALGGIVIFARKRRYE